MPLEFNNNAIVLSGETGTKLKSSILEEYYYQWWNITSGGPSKNFRFPTSIIEMNAATGEVYIENTSETLLGSAGHALKLKFSDNNKYNLRIICIEENNECYKNLKKVLKRRWPQFKVNASERDIESNNSSIYLIHKGIDDAINKIKEIQEIKDLGNSIFFFDPLLNVDWNHLEKVAKNRITSYHKTGTEFIVFLFTSDWFQGRKDFSPLPKSPIEKDWSSSEKITVERADNLFGNKNWRINLLNETSNKEKEQIVVSLYCNNLFKWFRYVLPLPFKPKKDQLYHLFFCSNYEDGINITKSYYKNKTNNPRYSPKIKIAYKNFSYLYPEVFKGIKHPKRPLEWKILWKIIKEHEFGICDPMCSDFKDDEPNIQKRIEVLNWLEQKKYIIKITCQNDFWTESYQKYKLNWSSVIEDLKIDKPMKLIPIEPNE